MKLCLALAPFPPAVACETLSGTLPSCRESVLKALAGGISANDIVDYLQMHPHPQVLARARSTSAPVVPEVCVCGGGGGICNEKGP